MNLYARTDLFARIASPFIGKPPTITLHPHLTPEQRQEAHDLVIAAYPPEGYGCSFDGSTFKLYSAD